MHYTTLVLWPGDLMPEATDSGWVIKGHRKYKQRSRRRLKFPPLAVIVHVTDKEVTMKKVSFRISRIASPLMIVWAALASGSTSWAQNSNGDGACSNQTLHGDYGFAVEGLVFPAPGVEVPIRGVAMTHFDGQGHLSQVDHLIGGGDPLSPLEWTPGTGTYHVNADCTGTAHIDIPSLNDFVNLSIVVVKQGKEIHTVVTPPYNGPKRTVTSAGIRRD